MGNFFNSLPKTILAILALVVGFVLIIVNDPPKSVCSVQLGNFQESQKRFLYTETIKGVKRLPLAEEQIRVCRASNSSGGCNELFFNLRKLNSDLSAAPTQCATTVGGESEVNKFLWKGYRLMVELAWGTKPPSGYQSRFAWLDSSDIALFCDLKGNIIRIYGDERHRQFQEEMFKSLPQAALLTRDQVWQRSILSTRCESVK